MTPLEQLAADVTRKISRMVLSVTTGTQEKIQRLLVQTFEPVCVKQEVLRFEDVDSAANDDQCATILKLLKERRSAGAANYELAKLALKYTSRISDLRRDPYFYTITCKRESGRTTRYFLHPAEW